MDHAAKGTLLKIGDGNINPGPEAFLTVGRVFRVGEVKGTRETIDVTAHDSPGNVKEFIASLIEYGAVNVEYRFRSGEAGQDALKAAWDDGLVHNFRIVFPATVGKRWAIAAIVTEHGISEAAVDGVLNGTATLKISGEPSLENDV
jgi:predicted secreted protein